METVLANEVGKVRRATLNGRKYVVAPLRLIVPGVLAGSQGPIYYPSDLVTRDPVSWNHMPIVVKHPVQNDAHVSARSPVVLESQGVGFVFHAKAEGSLDGEAWLDEENTNRVDSRIIPWLEAGRPVEVSTGLFLDTVAALEGATHNGKPYKWVATGLRPDHLAILPDEVGACSVKDGCGLNVNAEQKSFGRWLLDLFRKSKVAANADDALPSEKVDPDAACQILHDGTVHGEPLTDDQRKMFAAACDEKGPAGNAWSEAAREAAAAARKAKGSLKSRENDASVRAGEASKVAAAAGTADAHVAAARAHEEAAAAHAKVGGKIDVEDDPEGHAARAPARQAAAAHRKAAEEHYRHADRLSSATHNEGTTAMDKKALVSWLTTNCDCWKGSEAVLNGMSEEALKKVHADAKRLHTVNVIVANSRGKKAPRVVVNADGGGEVAGVSIADLADLFQITTDPKTDPVGFTKELKASLEGALAKLSMDADPEDVADKGADEAVENPDGTPVAMSATPTGNRRKAMTANQWLATAPPEIQSAVKSAMEIERAERTRLVRQLTANVADDGKRKKLWAKFMAQPVDELRDLVSLLPAQAREQPEPVANYFGATGVADAPAQTEEDARDYLPVPTVNYAELADARK
jgi:hypothetical protein